MFKITGENFIIISFFVRKGSYYNEMERARVRFMAITLVKTSCFWHGLEARGHQYSYMGLFVCVLSTQ